MLPTSAVVKLTARTAMKGKYLRSVIAGGIFFFAFIICLYVSELIGFVTNDIVQTVTFAIFTVLALLPLLLGVFRFFRRLIWGAEDNPIEVFFYFSDAEHYKKALTLILMFTWRIAVFGIPLFLPAVITELLSRPGVYSVFKLNMPVWSSNLWIVTVFLSVAATVVLLLILLKFYLAPFLLVADEGMEPGEAMHMSAVISKRSGFDFFILVLSFLPYILASVFMVPLIFILPYFITAYLVHSRFAVTQYNKAVDNYNNSVGTPTYAAEM